jgi:hypothetical protein
VTTGSGLAHGNSPEKAGIGDIVELDARLRDYGGGLIRGTLEEIIRGLEDYEQLVQRASEGVHAFHGEGDKLALIEFLSNLRDDLSALRERSKRTLARLLRRPISTYWRIRNPGGDTIASVSAE